MPIHACGINHHTAPLALRECVVFDRERITHALGALKKHPAVNEAVVLSTCNRTEIYGVVNSDHKTLGQWLSDYHAHLTFNIHDYCYMHSGFDAVLHLIRVASGLDSMVLGEPQILGQIKQAYLLAEEYGMVGPELQRLFPAVFNASKTIRHSTAIGKSPVSLAYATIQLAEQFFPDLSYCKALLVGAGEIMELIAMHLAGRGVKQMTVASRTIAKARRLADQFSGQAVRIGDIPHCMKEVDLLITGTASQLPIIGKGMIETALKQQPNHPFFIADLAVPRDVEPEVGALQGVYLYNIDQLHEIILRNLHNRHAAAAQAEEMAKLLAVNYLRRLRIVNAADLIREYRSSLETVRQQVVAKALSQLDNGQNPQEIVTAMSHDLINKVMHKPTVKIRQAASIEDREALLLIKELFDV